MTHAFFSVYDVTYGGVYYCADFTASGAQPVWTKLTVTGLPNLKLSFFGVDKNDPLNMQYVACETATSTAGGDIALYIRNGGNWSKILDSAAARTVAGVGATYFLSWMYIDPTRSGTIYTVLYCENNSNEYMLQSADYGATWTAHDFGTGRFSGSVYGAGDHIWVMYQAGQQRNPWIAVTDDGGTSWAYRNQQLGAGQSFGEVDPYHSDRFYHNWDQGTLDYYKAVLAGGVVSSTLINNGVTFPAGKHKFRLSGRQILMDAADILYTDDDWSNVTTTGTDKSGVHVITLAQNSSSTVLATCFDTVQMWVLDSEDDTTWTNRSGANFAAAPYTDSLPGAEVASSLSEYGIWFGELPSSTGVFVFSVEMEDGDNTWDDSLFSYDALGSPMGGDRSSFRDMYADGFDVYHAEDVHADTPQIHAPWPAADGEAPVSDGTKYVPTDIITQAEFDYSFYVVALHSPVTLDADAALILDLQSATGQEIGLDTQQPTYVWMGPSFAPADEPTFQPMYIEQLANVVTTAPIGDGEVLTFDEALGQWVNAESVPSLDDLHEHIINEDHTADCNGVAVNFSTTYVFRPLSTQVYLNGLRQRLGPSFYLEDVDYNGITFNTAPEDDDMLWMDYIVEYIDYLAALSDSENVDMTDSEDFVLEDSS